jgi:hypothetical protein
MHCTTVEKRVSLVVCGERMWYALKNISTTEKNMT